jgi:hypothetical protein
MLNFFPGMFRKYFHERSWVSKEHFIQCKPIEKKKEENVFFCSKEEKDSKN